MHCKLPGSFIHGVFQARVLEWVAISFSRGSSWPRDRGWVSRIAGRHFTVWATREATRICINPFNLFFFSVVLIIRIRLCVFNKNTPPNDAMSVSARCIKGFVISVTYYWYVIKEKWSHSVVSDSLRPHGLQPTRLLCPWDFPGKSTGAGCHCLLWMYC